MQNFHELIQGFHNFKEDYFLREREFFSSLVHGQSPKTLVVACCDSRVDPAILMGAVRATSSSPEALPRSFPMSRRQANMMRSSPPSNTP